MDNTPAFPSEDIHVNDIVIKNFGLTKREWFAGMALQGILAYYGNSGNETKIAQYCFGFADAMLAESKKCEQ